MPRTAAASPLLLLAATGTRAVEYQLRIAQDLNYTGQGVAALDAGCEASAKKYNVAGTNWRAVVGHSGVLGVWDYFHPAGPIKSGQTTWQNFDAIPKSFIAKVAMMNGTAGDGAFGPIKIFSGFDRAGNTSLDHSIGACEDWTRNSMNKPGEPYCCCCAMLDDTQWGGWCYPAVVAQNGGIPGFLCVGLREGDSADPVVA